MLLLGLESGVLRLQLLQASRGLLRLAHVLGLEPFELRGCLAVLLGSRLPLAGFGLPVGRWFAVRLPTIPGVLPGRSTLLR